MLAAIDWAVSLLLDGGLAPPLSIRPIIYLRSGSNFTPGSRWYGRWRVFPSSIAGGPGLNLSILSLGSLEHIITTFSRSRMLLRLPCLTCGRLRCDVWGCVGVSGSFTKRLDHGFVWDGLDGADPVPAGGPFRPRFPVIL